MKTAYLIIHGFGGGVFEVLPLADYLSAQGFKNVCVQLKGHTGKREDMQKTSFTEWIASAEQELIKLKESADEIVAIGFSMGGLIAFDLAAKYEFKAIVTINTPIYYWNLSVVVRNLVEDIKSKNFNLTKRYLVAAKASPLFALIQFLKLLNQAKQKINKTRCPLLVIQTADDDTVQQRSVEYIISHVSSERKEIYRVPKGGHLVFLGLSADEVISAVGKFLFTI